MAGWMNRASSLCLITQLRASGDIATETPAVSMESALMGRFVADGLVEGYREEREISLDLSFLISKAVRHQRADHPDGNAWNAKRRYVSRDLLLRKQFKLIYIYAFGIYPM